MMKRLVLLCMFAALPMLGCDSTDEPSTEAGTGGGDGDAPGDGDGTGDGDGIPPTPPPPPPPQPPAATVTWTQVWEDVIVQSGCAGGPFCHGGPSGGLTLLDKDASYMAMVDAAAEGLSNPGETNCADTGLNRITSGDPDNSLLIQKLEGTQTCGTAMPPGSMLPADQIMMVRTWIAEGAQDN